MKAFKTHVINDRNETRCGRKPIEHLIVSEFEKVTCGTCRRAISFSVNTNNKRKHLYNDLKRDIRKILGSIYTKDKEAMDLLNKMIKEHEL